MGKVKIYCYYVGKEIDSNRHIGVAKVIDDQGLAHTVNYKSSSQQKWVEQDLGVRLISNSTMTIKDYVESRNKYKNLFGKNYELIFCEKSEFLKQLN